MAAQHLDPKIRMVWRVRAFIRVVVLAIVLVAASGGLVTFDGVPTALVWSTAILVLAAALTGAWWWPVVSYGRWTYEMGDDALELAHGVVFRVRSVIPYFRVQHVDTSQGPIERRLGLANLKVHTASAATDAELPGLAGTQAEQVRRLILDRAGAGDAV